MRPETKPPAFPETCPKCGRPPQLMEVEDDFLTSETKTIYRCASGHVWMKEVPA